MKIFNITDVPRFFAKVMGCDGRVYYRDEKGACHDLKELVSQLSPDNRPFRVEAIGEIELILEREKDFMGMCRYAFDMK